ncbi:MAG: hypothetical protein NTZ14_02185 [Hyphomicrobiales bacterium]|nr:hypothetical protein [Hyphomicrobiales bacterium]
MIADSGSRRRVHEVTALVIGQARRKAEMVAEDIVRMLRFDPVLLKLAVGKILEVGRDDHIASPRDGRRENVSVVHIRQQQ